MKLRITIIMAVIFNLLLGGFGSAPVLVLAASSDMLGAWNGLNQLALLSSAHISSSLKKRINKLPDEAQESLPIPVLFGISPDDLAENFGDPRSGGRSHEGLDMMAPKGAPIVSPTDAVVLSVGTGGSSGNTVSTANPGGETFVYMHLDRVADLSEGDAIEAGDLIGYCGNTGNASGGAAHLHFEIQKNGATDPYPRLTNEFSLEDKINFVAAVLEESEDAAELAQFLAGNYPDQFILAKEEGIDVPDEIADVLDLSAQGPAGGKSTVLSIGSSGNAVKTLQTYLISKNKGAAAGALANTGATGYFGQLTFAALVEYQKSAGVTASGTYAVPVTGSFFANLDKSAGTKTDDVKAAKIEELKAMIALLQAQILALQQQQLALSAPPLAAAISVDIKISNQTKDVAAANAITVAAGDVLEFQISVANSGKADAEDIIVRNNFPAGITSWENVLVEGRVTPGEIDKELRIGALAAGEEKTVTCTAKVAEAIPDTLTNIAVAYNDDIWGRAMARVTGI